MSSLKILPSCQKILKENIIKNIFQFKCLSNFLKVNSIKLKF
jgi:hypothetical protein